MKYYGMIICFFGLMHLPVSACCRRKPANGMLPTTTSHTGLVALVPDDRGDIHLDRWCSAGTTGAVGVIAAATSGFVDYAVTSGTLADNESVVIAWWVAGALKLFAACAGLKATFQCVTGCPCVPKRVVCCGGRLPVKLH